MRMEAPDNGGQPPSLVLLAVLNLIKQKIILTSRMRGLSKILCNPPFSIFTTYATLKFLYVDAHCTQIDKKNQSKFNFYQTVPSSRFDYLCFHIGQGNNVDDNVGDLKVVRHELRHTVDDSNVRQLKKIERFEIMRIDSQNIWGPMKTLKNASDLRTK